MWERFLFFVKKVNKINGLHRINGGEGGIRTHGRDKPTPVFKTSALNHSATSPFEGTF